MTPTNVIAIRAGPRKALLGIYRCLDRAGVNHIEVEGPVDVPAALGEDGADAVLVFNTARGEARETLRILRRDWAHVPVVVVVDKTSFDEYYELMCEGAYDYFEVSEGAEVIAEALRWAAHSRVSPPRAACVGQGTYVGIT